MKRMQRLNKRRSMRVRRGVAAIEFALTFPIVAVILLGSLEFGWYFSRLAMVNSAAYDGARFGGQYGEVVQSINLSQSAVKDLLGDMGFDCEELTCDIEAKRSVVEGVRMLALEVSVEYVQLTGLIPSNEGSASNIFFRSPDTLRARAVATVVAAP
jgi:hypothetical protein